MYKLSFIIFGYAVKTVKLYPDPALFTLRTLRTLANIRVLTILISQYKRNGNVSTFFLLQLSVVDLVGCALQSPVVSYALVRTVTCSQLRFGMFLLTYRPCCEM